ncbi:hypothetical protein NL676_003922 [Syzygium grande]|nr:hypothetical protein NL676_003922 [Syzygium grande]
MISDSEDRIRQCNQENLTQGSDELVKMILLDAVFVVELFMRNHYVYLQDENDEIFSVLPGHELASTRVQVKHLVDYVKAMQLPSFLRDMMSKQAKKFELTRSAKELHEAGVKFRRAEGTSSILDVIFRDGTLVMPHLVVYEWTEADDGRLLRTAGYDKYNGNLLSLGRPPHIKDGSNTPMNVIHNEGLDLCLTLGATSQTNIIELNAHQNNIPLYVIRNSGCNAHQTLGCNDKIKENAVIFGGVEFTANDEAMVDNQNSAQSLEATSRVGMFEPNAHSSPERNLNPAGNVEKQKISKERCQR